MQELVAAAAADDERGATVAPDVEREHDIADRLSSRGRASSTHSSPVIGAAATPDVSGQAPTPSRSTSQPRGSIASRSARTCSRLIRVPSAGFAWCQSVLVVDHLRRHLLGTELGALVVCAGQRSTRR